MVKVPPPKKNTKGSPASLGSTTPVGKNNLSKPSSDDLVSLNFKINAEFAKDWKVFCAVNDFKQVELFKEMFDFWKANH